MMIVVPMFIQTVTFGTIFENVLGDNPGDAIAFAGILLAVAAGALTWIKEQPIVAATSTRSSRCLAHAEKECDAEDIRLPPIVVGRRLAPRRAAQRSAWLAAHDDADLVIVCAYSELSRRAEARNVANLGGDTRIGLVTGRAEASAAVGAAVGVTPGAVRDSWRPCSSTAKPASALLATAAERLISSSWGFSATPASSPAKLLGTVATEVCGASACSSYGHVPTQPNSPRQRSRLRADRERDPPRDPAIARPGSARPTPR